MYSAPQINSDELWRMSDEDFNKWRIENDFPRILKFFQEKLFGFSKWQKEFKLTDEDIINEGISDFIKEGKIKYYVTAMDNDEKVHSYISIFPKEINQKFETLPGSYFSVLSIKPFTPFESWVNKNKIIIHPRATNNRICITRKESFKDPEHCADFILDELQLLKLGGYVDRSFCFDMGWRKLAFVNIDHLLFDSCDQGSRETIISYSSCSFWEIKKSSLHFFRFYNVDLNEFKVNNSTLDDWQLFYCKGYDAQIKDSVLMRSQFGPGEFSPYLDNVDLRDSRLLESYFKETKYHVPNIELIRRFKNSFAAHGQHNVAGEYYYYEKCNQRIINFKNVKFHFKNILNPKDGFNRKTKNFKLRIRHISYLFKYLKDYLFGLPNWLWWGYGERPVRVLLVSLFTIIVGSIFISYVHKFNPYSVWDAIYYSVISFLTLGDSEFKPEGITRVIVSVLALLGILNLGLLIAGFTNKSKY